MTSPSEPSRQDIDDQLREMLKYLRLGRLLAHWEETLQKARQGRYVEVEPARSATTLMHKRHQRKTTIDHLQPGLQRVGIVPEESALGRLNAS